MLTRLSIVLVCLTSIVQCYSLNNSLIDEIITINTCDQTITESEFILESPQYPTGYANDLNCRYTIQNTNLNCPFILEVNFVDFQLESSLGCMKDRLEIDNKDALCGEIVNTKSKTYNFDRQMQAVLKLRSDGAETSRGFKLMIRRIQCNGNMTATRRTSSACSLYPGFPSSPCGNNPTYPNYPNYPNYPIAPEYPTDNFPQCCLNSYNRPHFYMSSPQFPNSQNSPTDCVFRIYRATQNICQVRIYVKFAWLGEDSGTGCNRGFFEIDGRRYCGCKTGITIYSRFNNWENTPITIRYRNEGYPRTTFNGITFEVFQERCSTRQSRQVSNFSRKLETFDESPRDAPGTVLENRNFIHTVNEIICRKFSLVEWLAIQALDIFQQTGKCITTGQPPNTIWPQIPTSPGNCQTYNALSGVFQSPGYPLHYARGLNLCYRFYRQPNYCGFRINIGDFDVESSPNCERAGLVLYQKGKFCGQALKNSVVVMNLSNKPYEDIYFVTDSWQTQCGRGFYGTFQQTQCTSYPNPIPTLPVYPTNPTPPNCPAYPNPNCPTYPTNPGYPTYPTNPTLPVFPTNPIPNCPTYPNPNCPTYPTNPGYPGYPTYPPNPSYPVLPPYPTYPDPSVSTKCGQVFRNEYFTITAKGAAEPLLTPSFCDYHVFRLNQNICQISLTFLRFDLECRYEHLLINNQEYCGPHLSGQSVIFPFNRQQDFTIIYYKKNLLTPGSPYQIQGQQSAYNCDYAVNLDDIPLERTFNVGNKTTALRKKNK